MGRFAENTSVSSEASRAEIERILQRYQATGFMYGWGNGRATVGFVMCNRQIRFVLPLPDRTDTEFTQTPRRGSARSDAQAYAAWEQACRQRWRALALAIKAKLEAVECGIASFEEEFLAHIVLPNGQTYGEFAIPQIEQAYRAEKMPALLSWGGSKQ